MRAATLFSGIGANMKPNIQSAAKLPDGMSVKAPTRDLSGQQIGLLTVIEVVGKHKNNSLLWSCVCECGGKVDRPSSSLTKATGVASCGCYIKAYSAERLRGLRWNKGKTYTTKQEGGVFKNKGSWAVAVIRHYGDQCQSCGWAKGRCDAHHRVPRSLGGLNTIANGEVLCPNCHRLAHEGMQL